MVKTFDTLIDSYIENTIGIHTNFLPADLCDGLVQNIIDLQKAELLQKASIGNPLIKNETQQIRTDKIYWLDKKHNNIFEQAFLLRIEKFIEHLNSTCFTGINAYEFHYAVYEEGSFYKKHLDQFKSNYDRKFSLISYLNNNWVEKDGGQLIVYPKQIAQIIIPQGQTSVFFKSNEMEHEVVVSNKIRMSITGWLKVV